MILEIEGRRVEVDDSFAQLSPEQKEATVNEIAASFAPADNQNTVMGFVNKGIANTLGAPVDLVSAGLNKVGVDTGEAPLGGSESLKRAMGLVNADVATAEPETLGQKVAQGAGDAAGALLPFLGGARALSAASGVTGAVADDVARPFIAQPVRATSAEIAAGAGAAAGAEIADRMADDGDAHPLARSAAQIAGGAAAAMGPGAVLQGTGAIVNRMPVAGTALRGVKAAVAPFTETGGRVRAENRVQSMVNDPQAVANAMMQDNPGNLTPAQLSNDPNLLALERTVAEANPAIRDDLAARASASTAMLREEMIDLAGEGSPQNAVDFLVKRRDAFRERLAGFKEAAERRASQRIAQLDPVRRETENSLIVREEIDRAFERAQQQERRLWAQVPKEAQVPTQGVRAVFTDIQADTSRARSSDIPAKAVELLGENGLAQVESVREMHGLYSEMRQQAREALGGTTPNENRARIANEIADAILVDLGAVSDMPTAVGVKINEARAFTREMNETFGQGTVGQVRAQTRAGGDTMSAETTLARTVGPGGARAAVAVNDLRSAAGPGIDAPVQDFLRGKLMDRANAGNVYRPQNAEAFERANAEVLSQFPELRGEIGAANVAQRSSEARSQRVDSIVAQLDNPRQNVGAALINATPGDEVGQAIFKARDPARAAQALRRETAKDTSGRALEGVRRGTLDFLIGRAQGRYASDGTPTVSGNQLFGDLTDPKHAQVMKALFNENELSRMQQIARQFQGLEGARRAGQMDAVIDDMPNSIIDLLGRTLAARQGAKAGQGVSGASLLTANFASQRMRKMLGALTNDRAERLIQDAITDRDLFVALMTNNTSPNVARRNEQRIAEWLTGTAGVSLNPDGSEQVDESQGQP